MDERTYPCSRCKGRYVHAAFKVRRSGERYKCCRDCLERWPCPECPSKFATDSSLRLHERSVHQQIRDKACDECDKVYKSVGNLREHKKAKHPRQLT